MFLFRVTRFIFRNEVNFTSQLSYLLIFKKEDYMLLKFYKSRVWIMLFVLTPFIGFAQPSGWDFALNPTWATYTIPTDVIFDNVDALQAGDWIGAFFEDDGELYCAGAVEWTGTTNLALVAFGNDDLEPDKNGFAEGELVQWKFYRDAAMEEEEVFTDPEFFWINGDLGLVSSFFGEDDECVQTLSVITGFNWVSFNVLPDGNNINDALVNYDPSDGDIIKNSNSTITYFGGTWFPADHMLNPDVRYLLQRQNATPSVFDINGLCVNVSDPIDLVTGWNWIGYKPQTSQLVNDAFDIIPNPTDGDILKSASTTVTYFGGVWYPTDAALDPGVGYLFRLANGPAELIYNQGDISTDY
jgi:hypothetical protein